MPKAKPLNWLTVILLATIACRQRSGQSTVAKRGSESGPLFVDVTDKMGLQFVHEAGVEMQFRLPEIMGAGGALFDYDNDDDLDLLLLHGVVAGDNGTRSLQTGNRLFRSEPGGTFQDVTGAAGLGDSPDAMGCALGDIDNDGDLDVFVTSASADAMFRNNGNGSFADISASSGIAGRAWGSSACFFDFDSDGLLDLFVARYVENDASRRCTDSDGAPDYCGPEDYIGVPDALYRNNGPAGATSFTDISAPSGIASLAGKGLGVSCQDFDGDVKPDVFVANDGEPNFLWINRSEPGEPLFVEEAVERGCAVNAAGRPEAGMGVATGDADSDGSPDLFVTHLWQESNTLYLNDGSGVFDDVTEAARLGLPSIPFTGFGTAMFDYDHDGDLDIAVANGRVFRDEPLPGAALSPYWNFYAETNQLFENVGHPRAPRFNDVSGHGGDLTKQVGVGRGLMTGDMDADGDPDVVVTHCGGRARVYRNDSHRKGRWLMIRAVDPGLSRDAIGASITVDAGGRIFSRDVSHARGYLTNTDANAHFGLGDVTRVDRLTVQWPGGRVESFPPPPLDRKITLIRGMGNPAP